MEIFEFHFNPKNKKSSFEKFTFEPPSSFERFGSIHAIIELQNPLSSKPAIIGNLVRRIKEEYYSNAKESPEEAFKKALLKANEYLTLELSKNNTDWLGNLNCVIFSLREHHIAMTKSGKIDILISHGDNVSNIGDKIISGDGQKFLNISLKEK